MNTVEFFEPLWETKISFRNRRVRNRGEIGEFEDSKERKKYFWIELSGIRIFEESRGEKLGILLYMYNHRHVSKLFYFLSFMLRGFTKVTSGAKIKIIYA